MKSDLHTVMVVVSVQVILKVLTSAELLIITGNSYVIYSATYICSHYLACGRSTCHVLLLEINEYREVNESLSVICMNQYQSV